MAVPKRRTSKMKQRMRRGANRWRKPLLQTCPECGSRVPGHIACPSCGESATPGGVPFWVIILSVTSLSLSFMSLAFPGQLGQILGDLFSLEGGGAVRWIAASVLGIGGLIPLVLWREPNDCGACGHRWAVKRGRSAAEGGA